MGWKSLAPEFGICMGIYGSGNSEYMRVLSFFFVLDEMRTVIILIRVQEMEPPLFYLGGLARVEGRERAVSMLRGEIAD